MPEREMNPEADDQGFEDEGTIEEMTEEIRKECSDVYGNIENGISLDEILVRAEASYEKDKAEWDNLLDEMKKELSTLEEEDEIAQTLERYTNRSKSLS